MFTRCPECHTLFRLHAETLRIAQGQVRCGRCGTQFDALDSLAEDPLALPDSEPEAEAPVGSLADSLLAERADPVTEDAIELDDLAFGEAGFEAGQSEQDIAEEIEVETEVPESDVEFDTEIELKDLEPEAPAARTGPADDEETAGSETEAGPADREPDAAAGDMSVERPEADSPAASEGRDEGSVLPESAEEKQEVAGGLGLTALDAEAVRAALMNEEPEPENGRRTLVGLIVLVLLLTLGGQWVYMQRVPLYEIAGLRPWLQQFCALTGCDLPLVGAPERIEIVERVVQEHPRVARALMVELTFVSRARDVIAYPLLEMRLSDVTGNYMAARRFKPSDYLKDPAAIKLGLAPNQPVHVILELAAPQTEVVSFQFDFK